MALGDVYRASLVFTAPRADGDMVFTLHYRVDDKVSANSDQEEAQDIADRLRSITNSFYLPFVSVNITQTVINVIGITQSTVQAQAVNNTLGSVGEENVSYRNSVLLSFKSGLRGRSFNGRANLMAPTEGQQTSGQLNAGFIADIAAYSAELVEITGGESDVYQLGTWSRVLNSFAPTVNLIVRSGMATVRNRQDLTV